jgi:uncharacterized SAM-binding protein YcdF (DUF218 family)
MEPANQTVDPRLLAGLARRMLRAAVLVLGSGGVLWWLTARRIRALARSAGCVARDAQAIVIPGHRLAGGDVGPEYALRLCRAIALWRERPERALLLSGRAEDLHSPSEALAGMIWLLDLGLPVGVHVVLDEMARDTVENLRNARLALGPGQRAAIVSNRYHLARCGWIAHRLGLDWPLCAAESRWHGGAYDQAAVAREALVLLGLAGWRSALRDPLGPAP